jgi:GPH family glycoside/pentoside/hexuronide:cation symporter
LKRPDLVRSAASPVISRPRIPLQDRIPFPEKLTFSIGASTDYVVSGLVLGTLWLPYFNIGLGINPAILGVMLMVLQGWNAMIDPIFGNVSDNLRTRWGRRRPLMAVGAVMTAALFPLLWRPPAQFDESEKVVYLIVVGLIFFTAFSCWAMPYYALQLELTPNYDERTRLAAWMTLIAKFNVLLSGWAMAIISGSWFSDAGGTPDIVRGMKASSWFIAVFILVAGLLPVCFVRERYYETEARHQQRDPFWQSLRESARSRPLWGLVGIMFFLVLGTVSVASLGQYLNIYYVCHGRLAESSILWGWKSTVLMITGIACIWPWMWLGEKFDKKTIVAVMMGASMTGHLLNYWCMTPAMPYLQLIPSVFESAAVSAVWLFLPSMKGDVADYDELGTSRRREGAINAFFSWFFKAAMTCSMGLGGLLLDLTGFDVKLAAGQPEEVLQRMFAYYLFLPLIIWGLGLLCVWLYPLNRQKMAALRTCLENRRGVV